MYKYWYITSNSICEIILIFFAYQQGFRFGISLSAGVTLVYSSLFKVLVCLNMSLQCTLISERLITRYTAVRTFLPVYSHVHLYVAIIMSLLEIAKMKLEICRVTSMHVTVYTNLKITIRVILFSTYLALELGSISIMY